MDGINDHPNVQEILRQEGEVHIDEQNTEVPQDSEAMLRARILHVLTIFPKLSPTMLQMGIGTSQTPAVWKPVLEKMITEGSVVRYIHPTTTPAGRQQSYTVLTLPIAEASEAEAAE